MWPDHIYVVITPNRVALMHASGLPFRGKVITEKSVNLQSSEDKATAISEIISTLSKLLSSSLLQGAKLEVLLSSHFVRMELLPPLMQALNPEEQLKRAQLHFERIYGAIARQWSFCSQAITFQQPTLAAAIDQVLWSSLQNVVDTHKLKLVSVEPSLMQVLMYWRTHFKGAQATLIFVEQACCNIVHLMNNRITSVSQLPYKGLLTPEELQTMLNRDYMNHGESQQGKNLYLFSPKNPNLSLVISGAKVQQLRLMATESTAKFTRSRLLKLLGET